MLKIQLSVLLILFGILTVQGQTSDFELLRTHSIKTKGEVTISKEKFQFNPFDWALWVYKKTLSEQISAHCEFEPSCSSFSLQAIHELGYVKGIFLSADRLTRCNGYAFFEAPNYLIKYNAKIYDPPAFYRFNK